jgi:hypothetical protein
MLKPIGFLSYARQDAQRSFGKLNDLRQRLESELGGVFGGKVSIWQDTSDLAYGDVWWKKITTALDTSTFFVPILTPAFFASEYCMKEVAYFRGVERKLGRDDLIFPVHFVDCHDLEAEECHDKDLYDFIQSRQAVDFTQLRTRSFDSEPVWSVLSDMSRSVRRAIRRKISVPVVEPPAPAEASAPPAPAAPPMPEPSASISAEPAARIEPTVQLPVAEVASDDATGGDSVSRKAPEIAAFLVLKGAKAGILPHEKSDGAKPAAMSSSASFGSEGASKLAAEQAKASVSLHALHVSQGAYPEGQSGSSGLQEPAGENAVPPRPMSGREGQRDSPIAKGAPEPRQQAAADALTSPKSAHQHKAMQDEDPLAELARIVATHSPEPYRERGSIAGAYAQKLLEWNFSSQILNGRLKNSPSLTDASDKKAPDSGTAKPQPSELDRSLPIAAPKENRTERKKRIDLLLSVEDVFEEQAFKQFLFQVMAHKKSTVTKIVFMSKSYGKITEINKNFQEDADFRIRVVAFYNTLLAFHKIRTEVFRSAERHQVYAYLNSEIFRRWIMLSYALGKPELDLSFL